MSLQGIKHPAQPFPRAGDKTLRRIAPWAIPIAVTLGFMQGHLLLAGALVLLVPVIIAGFVNPPVALMATLALIPVGQSLPGLPIHLSISELYVAVLFPIFMLKSAQLGKPLRIGPVGWPILLYLLLCLISSLPSFHAHNPAITAYAQMLVYMVLSVVMCASFPGTTDDLVIALKGAVWTAAIYALCGLITHNHILHDNKNYWGAFLGSTFVMGLEFWLAANCRGEKKKAKMLFLCLIPIGMALFLSLSRGGWGEAVAGSFILLLFRRQFRLMMRMGIVMVPIIAVLWIALPKHDKAYAVNISASAHNTWTRIYDIRYALSQYSKNPIFGVGVGLRKQMDATDIVIVTLAESGVQGVLAFLLIHVVVLSMAWRLHKRLDPRDPRFSLVAIGAALLFQRFAHGMVDQYWCRGPLIWAWCAVGMMMAVYFEVRQKPARRPGTQNLESGTKNPKPGIQNPEPGI